MVANDADDHYWSALQARLGDGCPVLRTEELAAYAEGRLGARMRKAVEAHLSRCPYCRQVAEELTAVLAELTSDPISVRLRPERPRALRWAWVPLAVAVPVIAALIAMGPQRLTGTAPAPSSVSIGAPPAGTTTVAQGPTAPQSLAAAAPATPPPAETGPAVPRALIPGTSMGVRRESTSSTTTTSKAPQRKSTAPSKLRMRSIPHPRNSESSPAPRPNPDLSEFSEWPVAPEPEQQAPGGSADLETMVAQEPSLVNRFPRQTALSFHELPHALTHPGETPSPEQCAAFANSPGDTRFGELSTPESLNRLYPTPCNPEP